MGGGGCCTCHEWAAGCGVTKNQPPWCIIKCNYKWTVWVCAVFCICKRRGRFLKIEQQQQRCEEQKRTTIFLISASGIFFVSWKAERKKEGLSLHLNIVVGLCAAAGDFNDDVVCTRLGFCSGNRTHCLNCFGWVCFIDRETDDRVICKVCSSRVCGVVNREWDGLAFLHSKILAVLGTREMRILFSSKKLQILEINFWWVEIDFYEYFRLKKHPRKCLGFGFSFRVLPRLWT